VITANYAEAHEDLSDLERVYREELKAENERGSNRSRVERAGDGSSKVETVPFIRAGSVHDSPTGPAPEQ
jgi:hypothetical protein